MTWAPSAPDSAVLALAAREDRVILSADTDFGALMAQARATRPSVILVRELIGFRQADLASIVLGQLDVLAPHFQAGAIAAVTTMGIRVRTLPLR
jgi:predicted nuclease of predicted toxin-antitoxin system